MPPWDLDSLRSYSGCFALCLVVLVWGFEVQGLVRPLGVVGVDQGTRREARVLDRLEVPGSCELFLEVLDEGFTESVLLDCIRRGVFLGGAVEASPFLVHHAGLCHAQE